jgi:hypothetical protein
MFWLLSVFFVGMAPASYGAFGGISPFWSWLCINLALFYIFSYIVGEQQMKRRILMKKYKDGENCRIVDVLYTGEN